MSRTIQISVSIAALAAAALLLFFAYFEPHGAEQIKHLKNHGFAPESRLIDRVQPAPDMILKTWKESDQKSDYTSYTPNEEETKAMEKAFNFLPEPVQDLLRQRLIGLYFISGFISAGATDWVSNEKGDIFIYMIMNPDTLKLSISDLLTAKENTCFKKNRGIGVQIALNTEEEYRGIAYILLHEAAHAADYVCNITPFTEPDMQRFTDRVPKNTPFTAGIWRSYKEPINDFTLREKISFYGIDRNDKIDISDAVEAYKQLSRSPFISLYGSLNWAEDLSEFFAFYHLTKKNRGSYTITVYENGSPVYAMEPAKNPEVVKRFKYLEVFYQPLVLPERK